MQGPSCPSPNFVPGQNFSRSALQALPGPSCAMAKGEIVESAIKTVAERVIFMPDFS
jgi:hypothetical protein